MKELNAIIQTYQQAKKAGEAIALATVVHVEGSSYRMPGARMLVQQSGQMTGAISGGCLEGDALRKALFAIGQKSKMLVTYDTSDEEVTLGVQLGCNGIVHILFEPIDYTDLYNPVELLKACVDEKREPALLITLFSLQRGIQQIGTVYYKKGLESHLRLSDAAALRACMEENAAQAIAQQHSYMGSLLINGCAYQVFYELINPAVALYIVGAGNDAMPLAAIAKSMGWQVTVVDGRESHLTKERFAAADKLLLRKATEALQGTALDSRSAFVLMTHNYHYDKAVLQDLMGTEVGYIGCLGPKKKLLRMLDDLRQEGNPWQESDIRKLHGPVGLNIGAEAPEEVALAIVAEILAVFRSADAGFLKDQEAAVHRRFKDGALLPNESEAVVDPAERIAATHFTCSLTSGNDVQ